MKTTRRRTYNIDPRYAKQRVTVFYARRIDGFTKTNEYGHSRSRIVGGGYGKTPQEAKLNARKTVKRREKPRPKNARDLADDRRYSEYVHQKFERLRRMTPRQGAQLQRVWKCEHEWRDTHPRATYAEACDKCGSKRGRNSGALDELRDYF